MSSDVHVDTGAATKAEAIAPLVAPTIQAGRVNKTAVGQLAVVFPQPFSTVPTVTLTPYWQHPEPVGSIETVNHVDKSGFTLNSGNADSNYFVNWVAIGH
jgi:hypothetical protein